VPLLRPVYFPHVYAPNSVSWCAPVVGVPYSRFSAGGRNPAITKNKRYEHFFDGLNDQRILQATAQLAPCTLPQQAYGSEPIQWQRGRAPEVWAWISWRDAPATKIPAVAVADATVSVSLPGATTSTQTFGGRTQFT
jgi:hypothetical protein